MLPVKINVFVVNRLLFVYLLLIASLFQGCVGLNMYKIKYNPEKKLYEYPLPGMKPAALRTNTGELVTEENFEQFITEMARANFMYPFDERMELAGLPSETDYKLAALYADAVSQIKERDYEKASRTIDKLEESYPQALFYTDVAFLKGYLEEKRGHHEKAIDNYNAFNKFSSQKYSERFRDHQYTDPNNTYWLKQKLYSADYIARLPTQTSDDFLQEFRAKYYFTNLQPGFTLSDEGLSKYPKGIFSLSLGKDFSSGIAGGLQYYRNLKHGIDINPEFSISKNMWELRMAIPVQLYRSDNNRFGVKISPFGQYARINNLRTNGIDHDIKESVFNYGAKASVGFFIIQRLAVGAYYTYNFYNANRPFWSNVHEPQLWWDNEYDISLYFPLIKGLNLKGGIKSGDWVAGFFLPGWELSYNLNDRNFVLRTEMY